MKATFPSAFGPFAEAWRAWLAVAFIVILPMPPMLYNGYAVLLAILGLVMLVRRRGRIWAASPVRISVVLFACLWLPIALSAVDANDWQRAANASALYIRFALMAVFICVALDETAKVVQVRTVVALVCGLYVADAGWQSLTGTNLIGNPSVGPQLTGMFYPKLQLGVVLAALTPVVLAELDERAKHHAGWWLALLPLTAVVALTLHRNSWVVFVLAVASFVTLRLVERQWRLRGRVLACIAGVALVGGMAAVQHLHFKTRLFDTAGAALVQHEQLEIQLGQRPDIWRTALNMYQSHWLNGVGVRGFRGAYATYAGPDDYWRGQAEPVSPAHPHQLVLEIAAETGSTGLIGYLLVLTIAIGAYLRAPAASRYHAGPWLLATLLLLWPLNINKAFYGFFIATFFWWVLSVYVATLFARPTIAPPPESSPGVR